MKGSKRLKEMKGRFLIKKSPTAEYFLSDMTLGRGALLNSLYNSIKGRSEDAQVEFKSIDDPMADYCRVLIETFRQKS